MRVHYVLVDEGVEDETPCGSDRDYQSTDPYEVTCEACKDWLR